MSTVLIYCVSSDIYVPRALIFIILVLIQTSTNVLPRTTDYDTSEWTATVSATEMSATNDVSASPILNARSNINMDDADSITETLADPKKGPDSLESPPPRESSGRNHLPICTDISVRPTVELD